MLTIGERFPAFNLTAVVNNNLEERNETFVI